MELERAGLGVCDSGGLGMWVVVGVLGRRLPRCLERGLRSEGGHVSGEEKSPVPSALPRPGRVGAGVGGPDGGGLHT